MTTGVLVLALGRVGAVVAVVVVAAELIGIPPRWLSAASVALLALVPVAVLANGLPATAQIGPGFAIEHTLADRLAGAGVALLVIGVYGDATSSRRSRARPGSRSAGSRFAGSRSAESRSAESGYGADPTTSPDPAPGRFLPGDPS